MRLLLLVLGSAANVLADTQSLASLCTVSNVQKALPAGQFTGLSLKTTSVTANAVYNATAQGANVYPSKSGLSYCNVTFSYSHSGVYDTVNLWYYLPDPSTYKQRFLATGGGGESINSGSSALLQGLVYGAVAGLTDGGFGGFNAQVTDAILAANGTIDYNTLFSFAYNGIHEMSIIGKQLAKNFYSNSSLHAYYFGCSEGGREGWSQVQRFGDLFDGAVIGAPAFRQAYQQVNHLTSSVVERVMGYAPPPCELEKINNDTIAACDPLDGNTDGVVSRTDLCKLHYDQSASIGKPYSCAASSGGGSMMGGMIIGGGGSMPAQNGTVSAKGVAVAKAILAGLHDNDDRQVYISYQPSAAFDDAQTTYNSTSKTWYASASGIGVQWIDYFLNQIESTSYSLDGVNYDTLRSYILTGLQKYADTMQTVWPDLEDFQTHGGKILHYHGESDPSVPAGSSVLYHESVRRTMFPGESYNASVAKLDDFYRLFLVPGAEHCGPSTAQPNGPWPQTTLETIIEWVENGKAPATLNGTHFAGSNIGGSENICKWPLRPTWASNSSSVACVYDDVSLNTWFPNLTSIPFPVY